MKIALRKTKPLSEEVAKAFERGAGIDLPRDYRSFLLDFDGAEPATNIFPICGGNECGVNQFPLKKVLEERKYVDNVNCNFLPVAWAECGNYVCIDLTAGGEVFFWDHEDPSDKLRLANSFDEFLQTLEPFDVNQVELKPGQVEQAWIDPDFLKGLKERDGDCRDK